MAVKSQRSSLKQPWRRPAVEPPRSSLVTERPNTPRGAGRMCPSPCFFSRAQIGDALLPRGQEEPQCGLSLTGCEMHPADGEGGVGVGVGGH